MHAKFKVHPGRILGFLLVGPLFLLVLGLLAWLHFRMDRGGINGFLAEAFTLKPIQQFGLQYGLRLLLPLYFGAGVLAWVLAIVPGTLARPGLLQSWRGREALGLGGSALLWAHLVLWWQVPTTLWVLPELRAIPFVVLFPLMALAALAYPGWWLLRLKGAGLGRRSLVLATWLLLWTGMAVVPQWLPRFKPETRGGTQPCKVLMLGIDGLRSDTFLAKADGYPGIRYENTYTVIPATRLLWHLLWGGDPMTYTIGHAPPSRDEYTHPHDLVLLRKAMAQGLNPRFYIDDGGTIGTAGRHLDLDDLLMPAMGWENFVNSNLAVGFPLYAVWENLLKPFPTTNPWAPLDAGVKEALRLGRGSGWVMFHSCLAHQPIFLSRGELAQTGRWWSLAPRDYEPKATIDQVTPRDVRHLDPRTGPFKSYQIRMGSILASWRPLWEGLSQDPQYRGAVRILFSDHGERFHHLDNGFQLQGVHGYNLDPWECRSTLLVAGPGFTDQVQPKPNPATISLLGVRDGIGRVLDGGVFDAAFLEARTPLAPIRYHTLSTAFFGPSSENFREEPQTDLTYNTYIAPGGLWFMTYGKSIATRALDASIAYAVGARSTYFKPLEGGGALESAYVGYDLVSRRKVDEPAFQKAKQEVERLLTAEALR